MTIAEAPETVQGRGTTSDALRRFGRDGYVVLRTAMPGAAVDALRTVCATLFDGDSRESYPQQVIDKEELAALVFDEATTAFLHGLLGAEYVLYPSLTVRRNFFTGWHVDQAFTGPGREVVWEPGYCHASVSIYLQENTAAEGGGIDVVPGTHLVSFDGFGQTWPQVPVALALPEFAEQIVRVEPAPGDVLIKHARLLHASTVPADEAAAGARDKYGFSFSIGRLDPVENNRFITHLASKRRYVSRGQQVRHDRHTQSMALSYPRDFPESFQQRAERAGVVVRTFDNC